jgi:hypothetical protein
MNAHDYDTISRYTDGEMDAGEQKAFEERLQQDASLRTALELYKEVEDTLKTRLHAGEEDRAFHHTLEQMQGAYFKPPAKVVAFYEARWWAAAAAAVVIAVVLVWSPWKQDLYRQYAAIEMAPVAERGTPADSLLQEATADFNEKKFARAVPALEILLQLDTANAYTRYYYAIALLETNQIEKSRQELTYLYNGNSIFRYDAAFYVALSYLKEKDRTACREWLNKIPADAGIYSKVQQLLKEL